MRPSAVGDGMSRLGADGLLLATAFLWGVTFVAQKNAAATMPALAFVAARFAVSAAVLAPLALWEFRRKPHRPSRDEWRLASGDRPHALSRHDLAAGGDRDDKRHQRRLPHRLLRRADPLRRLGAHRRASTRNRGGRRTGVAHRRLAARVRGGLGPPNGGDALVLLADFAWATGIALTPIFLARSGRPLLLAFVQYAVCAGLAALCSAVFESDPVRGARRRPRRRSCSPAWCRARSPIRSRSSPRRIRRPPRRPSSWRWRASSPRSRARSCSASV